MALCHFGEERGDFQFCKTSLSMNKSVRFFLCCNDLTWWMLSSGEKQGLLLLMFSINDTTHHWGCTQASVSWLLHLNKQLPDTVWDLPSTLIRRNCLQSLVISHISDLKSSLFLFIMSNSKDIAAHCSWRSEPCLFFKLSVLDGIPSVTVISQELIIRR